MRPTEPKREAPIIFIHYGPAHYLKWTLQSARRSNPDKQIIFLGDTTNRHFAKGLADFIPYEALSGGEKDREFQSLFHPIQGTRHRFNKVNGVDFWLRFAFRRWFLMEALLERNDIDAFWTFDSDTLILAPLGPREKRFAGVEATTQCKGECLNGWVGSRNLVGRYTRCMIGLFKDPAYLNAQRERLKTHAGLAFNEMDAFTEFRRRTNVRTCHAATPVDGEAFDDALAFVEGYEPSEQKVLGKTAIKRLWLDSRGSLYARNGGCGGVARLLTSNMSWMPDYLWRKIFRCVPSDAPDFIGGPPDCSTLRELDVREPLWEHGLRKSRNAIWRIRQNAAKIFHA